MKKTIAVLFFTIALIFIWTQSTMSPELSGAESGFIFNLVRPILDFLFGSENVNANLVRKIAHYTEFAVLGFFAFFFFEKEGRVVLVQFLFSLLTCLFIAFTDESIQIFSARGPSVVDVWLDFSGSFVGILVAGICQAGRKLS